ncbi:MAG: hypothetical protein ACFFCS_08345, partial [Candidatus Hodarchaeota archaeon]
APGNLLNQARLISYISQLLPGQAKSLMVNLFEDLLINDFLYTRRKFPIDKVYMAMKNVVEKSLEKTPDPSTKTGPDFWTLYMRIYEILWRKKPYTLCEKVKVTHEVERDAKLSARIVKTFSKSWFTCLKQLAYIFKAYFPPDMMSEKKYFLPVFDKVGAGKEGYKKIWGFSAVSDDEIDKPSENVYDGILEDGEAGKKSKGRSEGQYRMPSDYIETLRDLGVITDERKALVQYYTELAYPHLIPFPKTEKFTVEPLVEGTDLWEISESPDTIDYMESILESPVVFPGITTRKRTYGEEKGSDLHEEPIDIDIYIDTSGSMMNPAYDVSYATVAAFILSLSALRAGATVQATSWSGSGDVKSTQGFSRDKELILSVLLHFFADGTAFPLYVLDEYKDRKEDAPPVHIIVISDEGVDTMLQTYRTKEGKDRKGIDTIKMAMEKGKAEGTLLLNISQASFNGQKSNLEQLEKVGFKAYRIGDWKEVIKFAEEFSRRHFT